MLAFAAFVLVASVHLRRDLRREALRPDRDARPNLTPLRAGWTALGHRVGERVHRSRATLLGWPLVDIHCSAPLPPDPHAFATPAPRRRARGWIAIGDDARGLLLAIGSSAVGLVALGGRTLGLVSVGGVAAGGIALGGVGLGLVGIGGLGAGGLTLGGGAIGWHAVGGLALAGDTAIGGAAIAGHTAVGGVALARDQALGGTARARHANDAVARAALDQPLVRRALIALGGRSMLASSFRSASAGDSAAASAYRLDNGLRVRLRPITGADQVALVILYDLGGDHDPEGRSGLAHLVEHVYVTAAAGAEPARTAEALIRRYPAGANAQTGDRSTIIATVFPRADLDRELADAAARMHNLAITAADLDRERPRLQAEVANMFGRIPYLAALNTAREQVRPTPRGGRKGGTPDQVATIGLDELLAHYQRFYRPRNAILILAGAVDETAARTAVARHFAAIPAGEPAPPAGEPGAPNLLFAGPQQVEPLGPPQAVAALAIRAPAPDHATYAAYLILAARLMAASALPRPTGISDQPALYMPLLEDPDILGVSAAARAGETPDQALARLDAFLDATLQAPLRDAERAQARQAFALFLDTAPIPDALLARNPYGVALALGRREQLGIDPARLGAALDAVTEADLRQAARQVFAAPRRARAFVTSRR
jgi:zinc protease